jgi:tetratricopeptide (TPR) repeat protein
MIFVSIFLGCTSNAEANENPQPDPALGPANKAYERGNEAYFKKDYDLALEEFTQAIDLANGINKPQWYFYVERSSAFRDKREYENALADLEAAFDIPGAVQEYIYFLMGRLYLDMNEPSMGLAPILVDEIFSIIKRISDAGTTILLVEQNAYKALRIAARAYILETGQVVKNGPAKELMKDDAVKAAYLGG